MHRRDFLTVSSAALATSALSACATPNGAMSGEGAKQTAKAAIGEFGLDLTAGDASIPPGDNFYLHCNSTWFKANPIPADRTRWGTFDMLAANAEAQVRAIIEELAAKNAPLNTVDGKVGAFYKAYMDVDAIEAKGLAPLKGDLEQINACATHEDIAKLIADPEMPVPGPIGGGVSLDAKNPDRYIISVGHGGLGLPERDYYLKSDGQFPEIRAKYLAHIEKLLTLAGIGDGAAKASRILALETEIAKLHWPIAQRRDRDKTYNLKTRAEFIALAPDYPIAATLAAQGFQNHDAFILREVDAIPKLATLFKQTPVAVWKEYASYHAIANNASVLPKAIDDERFDFFGRTLNGQPQQRDRWKRAVDAMNAVLGEAIGQTYVARHFPPEAKAKMLDLVENVRKAYGERIDALTWMSAETKVVAREKLAAFRVKMGYPDKWKDYSKLSVVAGDAYGNAKRAARFEFNDNLARLNKPTDKDEWFMTPQTVNAYYNSIFNEIVFPAAILQPPFFDPNADPAVNYGGIGGVIGHEMGHGFDDQGSKSDARGVLRTWWNERDVAAFQKLGDRLVAQYDSYEPIPGMKLNGRLGLGENIGDNGGLQVALEAYKKSLGGKEAPVLSGLTGTQRFFLSWGQVWRTQMREQRLRNQIITGPHSPPEFRVNGTVRNMDDWYTAFNIPTTAKYYLPPEERVKIW
jgi:putative endopeptidase